MSDKDKFKFNSSYLKNSFVPNNNNDNNDMENEELIQEKLELENETPSKNSSKMNNHDITYSISEHRPQTSGFNESNMNNRANNLIISTSTINSKKRKPFENLTFYSEKKNIFSNESNINDNNNNSNNISKINKDKGDNESEMSEIQFKKINPLKESQTEFNISTITENEKSMIMSSYKLISRETIEKAKKFNKQYKTTPFWIKFFEDLENDSLNINSSYFKINNKNEYIKNLVDMIQRDADIYDRIQKSKEIKQATENEIKKFIEENNDNVNNKVNENSTKNNSSTISSSETGKKNIKSNNSSSTNLNNNNRIKTSKKSDLDKNNNNNINESEKKNDINNKFNQILETYNKLDEKEKKIYNNEDDYETFKFKLITGGKFTTDKEKEIENIPKTIKKLEKLEDIREKPMTEKEKEKEEILKYKGLKEFKTIDALYFGDDYTFEELNYNKIDFFAYNKESLPKILALDRRLHEIDPERYKTSINTELKKIQDEFNIGKEERMKIADKEVRDIFNKHLKETKETKKTIFDITPADEGKIKYKDYLHYNDEIKKERNEIKMELNKLDDKIKQLYTNKEVPQEQINKMNKEIEDYHLTEEYKQKYENLNIPGLILLNKLKKEIINFENINRELTQGFLEAKNILEIEQKKSSKEEKEKYIKEIVEPFYEHEKEVEKFEEENKNDFDKVKKLEESIKKEEELLNNIQISLNDLNENKNKYEEMFEEADKIIMENNKVKNRIEDNKNNEEMEEEYNPDEVMKKYDVDQIIKEQKENEKLIEDFNSQMKSFQENIKNIDDEVSKAISNKNIVPFEEFCQIPDIVKEYLKEKEKEKELKNNNIEKNNENGIISEDNNNNQEKLMEIKEELKEVNFDMNKVKEKENSDNDFEEIINDSLEIEENKENDDKKENEEFKDSLEIQKDK